MEEKRGPYKKEKSKIIRDLVLSRPIDACLPYFSAFIGFT